ncbi:peptide chain release factor-like protein [Penicillium capsulatum]|uniref:Peptide chain release factor-like protein n=1 Tax=Penicillium capsulatum TaxID=69766 RepID=A0A9W9IJL2_9EURO|nr:peptide chain release factor-like protein [Penicillium capsulatum]KAJ6121983.1 peptide chain release factor-like protein [Penicillium capsulatum]
MLRLGPWSRFLGACTPSGLTRSFTQTLSLPAKPLPPRLQINDADVTISYLKGTGPGGQKINKTNSAVQISHKPSGIVVKCQATRSRSQNEKIARQLLADKVEHQEKGEKSRVAMKAEAARKKKASKMKKANRKYRALDKEKETEREMAEGHNVDAGEEVNHGAGDAEKSAS